MPGQKTGSGAEHVDVIRGDDTYRFRADGSVELTRKGVGSGAHGGSIQDDNVIAKTTLNRPMDDRTGSAVKLGRTDMAEYGPDSRLKEFRTTAAPGAVFDRDGKHLRGGSVEARSSGKRWHEIARELQVLEEYIAKDIRTDAAVTGFLAPKGG